MLEKLGFHHKLSQHEICKRLLVVESEINRAQLIQDLEAAKMETKKVTQQVVKLGTVVSTVALVLAALKALKGGPTQPKNSVAGSKPGWFKRILSGARIVSSVWSGFRAAGNNGGHEAKHHVA